MYEPDDWRQFIDSSERNLKAVLFNNENTFPWVPVAYLSFLKVLYENLQMVFRNY